MNLKRAIKTFIKDPLPVSSFDYIYEGINIIDGEVHTEEPLRSPVQGKYCIGFHYESFVLNTPSGAPQPQLQKVKTAEVYTSFKLKVDGGVINVIPKKSDNFDRNSHLNLEKQYGAEFRGAENIIPQGAKVRIRGKLKTIDGVPTLKMNLISLLTPKKVSKKSKSKSKSKK